MSRISKQLAREIALKLVEPIDSKRRKISSQLDDLACKSRERITPTPVLEIFKSHPKYFNRCSNYIIIKGNHIYLEGKLNLNSIPCNRDEGDTIVAEKFEEEAWSLYNQSEKLRKEKTQLISEIENTLIKLSSFSAIKREFPEAGVLLPDENKNDSLMISIESTVNKIKQLSE